METAAKVHSIARDPYRFGGGETPVLQPGTVGWSASDLRDPEIYSLWEMERHEIIEGVLTILPSQTFAEGSAIAEISFLFHDYCKERSIRFGAAGAVDIEATPTRVLRPDMLFIMGDLFHRLDALLFPPPDTDWKRNLLILPPSVIIESVSHGREAHDRVMKRKWYAEFGVPNYWIVDAFAETLESLKLVNGAYEVDAHGREKEVVRPGVFEGLEIDLGKIWGGA